MARNKQLYQKLCDKQNNIPLFQRYDWYQSLYGDDWDVVVEEQGGEVMAFMPYRIRPKKGFRLVLPEPLVPYQGIWINYPSNLTNIAKLRLEKKVIGNIIEKLPAVDSFKQKFGTEFLNWLPFYWRSYEQETRYTYILKDITNLEAIFSGFKDKTRNQIRKAEEKLSVEPSNDARGFHNLKVEDYSKKDKKYPISFDVLQKNMDYTLSNNCGEILVAKNTDNEIQAMLYYTWDKISAYFIHSVSKENSMPGAMSLLIWEAIRRSSLKTKAFNFEGSMIESIESYFRGFGGDLTPYFEINKTDSKVLKLLKY